MHPKHNQTTKFEWTATHNFSVLGIILLYFKSGTISHTQFVGGDVSSTLNILFDKSKFNCIIANNNCAFWEHMLFMFFFIQVFFASVRSGGSSQVFFMTLNRNSMMNWWCLPLLTLPHSPTGGSRPWPTTHLTSEPDSPRCHKWTVATLERLTKCREREKEVILVEKKKF